MSQVSFDDTQIAFSYKSDKELRSARRLFQLINIPFLTQIGSKMALWSYEKHIPIRLPLVNQLYHQFCGGETLEDAYNTGKHLMQYNVDIILDYGVEALETEEDFDKAMSNIIETVRFASTKDAIPFISIKLTSLARFEILEKLAEGLSLTMDEQVYWDRAKERIEQVVKSGVEGDVKILIDAEESWIQEPVDEIAYDLMLKYNKDKAWVFNTYQMYREDRLAFLKKHIDCAEKKGFVLGAKIVRGAYMEKERERASKLGYPSPIQMDKSSTDRDYNKALLLLSKNHCRCEIFVGTHNEYSCHKMLEFMDAFQLDPKTVYFSQLYGMSDNISFNLAAAGFQVLKYLPYGPVDEAVPYLLRRAEENSSVRGQSSRELQLINEEIKRRKSAK